jgi:hypothetical protein
VFPDFLIIGAQKAGTTWLQRNLRIHPGIWMPKEKELHYFDEKIRLRGGPISRLRGDRPADERWRRQLRSRFRRFPRGLELEDVTWDLRYFLGKPTDAWYASLFEPGRGRITGETTPDYSVLEPEMIAHVHGLMPEAKIIFMMRSPIERPWSAMDMGFRISGRSWENVKDGRVYRHFDNRRSRLMTDYRRTLENWGTYYPPERIFVGYLEDIHFFPEELLRRLYEFLGADTSAKYRVIRRRIHSGLQSTIPTRFAAYLARSYREEISWLDERFGGYASFWLYCAERLAENPPEEDSLPYPLWESSLWKEWVESREVAPRSAPLASVRTA